MPKMRGIKPETWTDETLVEASPFARLLFIGMWNYACDNGHIEDKPRQIKMRVLPADAVDVDALLDELASLGLIERGSGMVKVPNLPVHQNIDLRFLTLCDHCAHDEQAHYSAEDRKSRRRAPDVRTTSTRRAPSVRSSGAHGEGEGEGEGEITTPSRKRDESAPETFDAFWSAYPKKVGKGQAVKAYKAALKKTDADAILDGLNAHLPTWRDTEARFIPNPATWLNGERWADEIETPDAEDPYAHLPSPAELTARWR